jgi:hypothetical protein
MINTINGIDLIFLLVGVVIGFAIAYPKAKQKYQAKFNAFKNKLVEDYDLIRKVK